MVNMTLFQIILLAAIRLDVNAAMHIVNLYGVIVQTKQSKYGTEGKRMNENKYYLKVDNRIVAECIPLEYALIFIKSIFENYYNDHEIVISIAEMERCEDCEVSE